MRVDVTWEDIRHGSRHGSFDNPLALAFTRASGVRAVVYRDRANGWVADYRLSDAALETSAVLPDFAQDFMDWWSYGRACWPEKYDAIVRPFSITDEE